MFSSPIVRNCYLSDIVDVILQLIDVEQCGLNTVLLIAPDRYGDLGVPVHGEIEGVPLHDQLLGLQLVVAVVHEPHQLGRDGGRLWKRQLTSKNCLVRSILTVAAIDRLTLTNVELALPVERSPVQTDFEVDPALSLRPGHDAGGPVVVHDRALAVLGVESVSDKKLG